MNNAALGAIKPHTGDNATVLDRHAGMQQAMGAMSSKTRSKAPATSINNQWTDVPGSGCGGNVVGYSKGGGCSS